jgi:hypothetical protein
VRPTLAAVVVALAFVAGACGGDEPEIEDRAARRLGNQISAVEFAIAGGAYPEARAGLAEIRATTIRMTDRGDVDEDRAPAILDAIDDLEVLLVRLEAEQPDGSDG